jgi:PEP-CTERM motif
LTSNINLDFDHLPQPHISMKKALLVLPVLLALAAQSKATTIILKNFDEGGAGARPLTDHTTNTPLAANSGSVSIGTFATLTDAQITSMGAFNAANRNALLADFLAFADSVNNPTRTGDTNAFDIPGLYSGVNNGINAAADPKIGKAIYTFIGNGPTLASSTQIGIVKDNDSFVLDDQPVITANAFLYEPTSVILVGQLGAQIPVGPLGGSFSTLQLAAVPEPSCLALLGLCGGFFVRRRRVVA